MRIIAYLKGHNCERCESNRVKIIPFKMENGSLIVDGATCEVCLKNVVLPAEPYFIFIKAHGTYKVD